MDQTKINLKFLKIFSPLRSYFLSLILSSFLRKFKNSILFLFPSIAGPLSKLQNFLYSFLFPCDKKSFLKKFSKGVYRNSQIALIQAPGWGVNTPPLSIASLSSYLRKHKIRVMPIDINIDMYQRNKKKFKDGWLIDVYDFWKNKKMVEKFVTHNKSILEIYIDIVIQSGVKIVGFSIYDSSYRMSLYLAKKIKSKKKDIVIAFGGPHASDFMGGKSILEDNSFIDIVLDGEGEKTLFEIVQNISSGKSLNQVTGIRFRDEGKIVNTDKRELIENLNSLSFPDFTDFNFSLYKDPFKIPISSSRGCVNKCIFCNERPFWRRYRYRSGESIFEEVLYQLKKHPNIRFFDFHDSLCNGNIKALEKFCDLVISERLKIQWAAQAIIRKEMDYNLFLKIKKSGCVVLGFGLETASPSLWKKIGKVYSVGADLDKIIYDAKKAGVSCNYNFMFGLPGETDEDAEENLKFIERNVKNIHKVNPSPAFCSISPGTIANKNPEKFGIDLSNGSVYWESLDHNNTYLKRIERFEKFISKTQDLKISSFYSHGYLVNKNEIIANYYFSIAKYEEAIFYYEKAIRDKPYEQDSIDKLEHCKKQLINTRTELCK